MTSCRKGMNWENHACHREVGEEERLALRQPRAELLKTQADREQRAQSPTGGTGLGELQVTQAEAGGHGLTFSLVLSAKESCQRVLSREAACCDVCASGGWGGPAGRLLQREFQARAHDGLGRQRWRCNGFQRPFEKRANSTPLLRMKRNDRSLFSSHAHCRPTLDTAMPPAPSKRSPSSQKLKK